MTAQMKLLHVHAGSRSYQITRKEAERLGLPVVVSRSIVVVPPKPKPDPYARQMEKQSDDLKRRRLIAEIIRAEGLGASRTCRVIAMKVALRTGFFLSDLKRTCRKSPLVAARQRAIFGARVGTDKSLDVIGRFYGLDHTTVYYSVQEHAKRIGRDAPGMRCGR
ncbi:chromosomal replication initiation protein [Labrenzia sp. THAF35]|uniref:helix-turn-helix domain-containing protein n=1 Tax=Labrenzia sp. THAF35 TaxID=2587854 RepID=UPI0012684DC6|nr:chromosomal replication initiation protein [Labrenzia sp. THAF35]